MGAKEGSISCFHVNLRLDGIISFLAGLQVVRVLWEIWASLDNTWPSALDRTIMPTVYGSCILSIMLMIISVCTTWGVYKKNIAAINISWWTYYVLTVLAFFNSAGHLSIICVTKGTFVAECIKESSVNLVLSACLQRWEALLVWATVSTMLGQIVNIGFTYCVYRYRILHPAKLDMTQVRPGVLPLHRTERSIIDDEGFQVVELK
ncbi:hypothetical protein J3Q64DRAFT_1694552 [Phycomyces blakesleeanus]|uniref:Uncharacterized protein n=2 Tax=Phycomyces blakesleeanus TaxID=4837 RepID=A0A162V4Z2_PHYB8|nr:hypothetical protein PHYBLDRAFT_59056 [Phycomyces blakesleeanus NRRL 1555(-)]OAD80012.1 hypothetical protein PHYBLDRAFT_59056 [Phycomyces blakesleeanus NRRL 1555(-)]|eukprot:XP_018298052.1 hypothetical protein PHYBLDRAFT_59056 [Phycomyces blakesleeanus NRRL 1555(-)]